MFKERLNCTPPLLSSETDQMCDTRFNLTEAEDAEIFQMFW